MYEAYVWKRIEGVTGRYHDSGGLLIVAESEEAAQEQWREWREKVKADPIGLLDYPHLDSDLREALPAPDFSLPIAESFNREPVLVMFPNAGCC